MEMNTRLQVEQPGHRGRSPGSTWSRCSFAWRQASRCGSAQEDVPIHGHAAEARLYAEDPARGFPAVHGQAGGARVAPRARACGSTPVSRPGSVVSPYLRSDDRQGDRARGQTAPRRSRASRRRWARPSWSGRTPMRRSSRPWFRTRSFAQAGSIPAFRSHIGELTRIDPAAEAGAVAAAVEALLAPQAQPANGAWSDPWSATDGFSLGSARRSISTSRWMGIPRSACRLGRSGPRDGGWHGARDGVRIIAVGGGIVVVGDGRAAARRAEELRHHRRRPPRRRRRDQGADARQGAGDLGRAGRERAEG